MKNIRFLAISSFLVVASAAFPVSLTGANYWWDTAGSGIRTSQFLSGSYYDTGDTAGTVGVDFTEYHTTKLNRENGVASTSFQLFISFQTGDIPVQVSNLRLTQRGKLVNSGGNAETPTSITGTGGYIFEYDDANADGSYSMGEGAYFTPLVAAGYYHTGVTGNGLSPIALDDSAEGSYILAPNTKYSMYWLTVDQASLSGLGGSPTAAVTLENFSASLAFDYQAVPEPGSMAALAFGLLALRRRKK